MERKPLEDAAQRFLRRCDAESTRVAYGRELKRFLTWIPERSSIDLLLDYRDSLRMRKLSRNTVRWRLTVVRAFLRFACERGCAIPGLNLDIGLPKGQRGFVPKVLSKAELSRLLKAPDRRTRRGARDSAILACLGLGGLRASEVCTLQLRNVEIGRNEILLRVHGKGGKVRSVSLPLPEAGAVRVWVRRQTLDYLFDEPLFNRDGARNFGRLDVHAIRYIVRKHATSSGLGHVSSHSLRHTEATLAIGRGLPLHVVRARLGHASILTTVAYISTRVHEG